MDKMIGTRIRTRRNELHITQTQIQESCGISSGNLSGIENGRYLPSAVALIELARILDCSIDWLLTGESLISTNAETFDIKENSDEAKLLQYYHEMSVADQEDILMIAQMKANKKNRKSSNLENRNPSTETA